MTKTKTIAMLLVIAIATIGAIGITIGTVTQSAHAVGGCPPHCDSDDSGHDQSFHDSNGHLHSHGHA